MEFDEMKKIWDAQKQENAFYINESALHNRVLTKQKKGVHITNISEWLLIVVNIIAAAAILAMTLPAEHPNVSLIFLSGWMLFTASLVSYFRYRRISGQANFNRTLKGDLQFAIDVAQYQVRLSALGRWNIVPIGLLLIAGTIEGDKPFWVAVVVLVFLFIANYASGWENNFYIARLRELETLKSKLEEEA